MGRCTARYTAPITNDLMARHFPNWLRSYMEYTRDTEAPTPFHFWTGVWTIAGALRRRVWIDMRKFQWTPNFYIILVGPAGVVTKSTSTRSGEHLLRRVPHINFGPQSATWQAITQSLEASTEYVKRFEDDPDPIPMSAVSMQITELGTLLKMEDRVLGDVMTSLWDGQLEEWGHNTKTTGNTAIKNPWLNIIGCTTPTWMQHNFPEQLIGGGLTSRMVFVHGDAKRQFIPYPDEMIPGREYYELENKLVEDLTQIASLVGEYQLSPEARVWGRAWYINFWQERPLHMASDRFSSYIARKQTHMHKLAIVLAAAKRDELIIQANDLQEAEALLTDVEPDMTKVFDAVGMVDDAKSVASIMTYVRAYGKISVRQLYYNFFHNTMAKKDFERALVNARDGELLKLSKEGTELVATVVKRVVN